MTAALAVSRGIDRLSHWAGIAASWLVLFACLISATNAVSRYLFSASSNAWLEIQWQMFAGIFLLGDGLRPEAQRARAGGSFLRFALGTGEALDRCRRVHLLLLSRQSSSSSTSAWPFFLFELPLGGDLLERRAVLSFGPSKLLLPLGLRAARPPGRVGVRQTHCGLAGTHARQRARRLREAPAIDRPGPNHHTCALEVERAKGQCSTYGLTAPAMFVGLILFMLVGFPVAFSLAALGLFFGVVAIEIGYFTVSFLQALPYRIFGIMSNELLLAIPFFTFMGVILERSGLAEDLLDGTGQLFGPMPGGLAYAVIFVGAVLGAITGTVAASVIAMGMISLPVMMRYGYDMRIATGVIAASGTITQLIPPSLVLVVLADQLGVSVGDMYLGADRALDPPGPPVRRLHRRACRSCGRTRCRRCREEARTLRGWALDRQGALGHGAFDRPDLPRSRHDLHGPCHSRRKPGAMGAVGAMALAAMHRRLSLRADLGRHGLHHADHRHGDLHPDRRDGLQPRVPGRQRRQVDRAHPVEPAGRAGRLPHLRQYIRVLPGLLPRFLRDRLHCRARCWCRSRRRSTSTSSGSASFCA